MARHAATATERGGGIVDGHRRMLYPIDEAAELLGIHRSTLYRRAAAGEITLTHNGKRAFVSARELDRYVARLESA
jgi:excisionase family DNA binding protein